MNYELQKIRLKLFTFWLNWYKVPSLKIFQFQRDHCNRHVSNLILLKRAKSNEIKDIVFPQMTWQGFPHLLWTFKSIISICNDPIIFQAP